MPKTNHKPRTDLKASTTKAVFAILLFALVYLLLVLIAVALTVFCAFAGIKIVTARPSFITAALGIGLASLGLMVLIFLIKFIFQSNKADRSHLSEIREKHQPELFAMIREIVQEVGTRFPKKVYLSKDVNASVFYDSSFWSMFFPVRKNLQIGLGLVNTVTKDELKAILSHEFGHFSQRSMKVGSFVYNVNRAIYNMLFENENYGRMAGSWAGVRGFIAIFVQIAAGIIEVIQGILRQMYGIVNKNYLQLSREMEFQADEIAASVTGWEPLRSSLLRMPLADEAFNTVLGYYQEHLKKGYISSNLYLDQTMVMNLFADKNEIPVRNGLPDLTLADPGRFHKPKLIIKDQWASHPSNEERIQRLEETGLAANGIDSSPANDLFKNLVKTQELLTQLLFKNVPYEVETTVISADKFESNFKLEYKKSSFPEIFNGYYNMSSPLGFNLDQPSLDPGNLSVEELFSDQQIKATYAYPELANDIQTLEQIATGNSGIKSFDYDGKKYKARESEALLPLLKKELDHLKEQVHENDSRIYQFFLAKEKSQSGKHRLKELYEAYFNIEEANTKKSLLYQEISEHLAFINVVTPTEQVKRNLKKLKPLEAKLKEGIRELLADKLFKEDITPEMRKQFSAYLPKDLTYFGQDQYFDENLQKLFAAMDNFLYLVSRGNFLSKKELLDYQASLIDAPAREGAKEEE